MNDDGEVDEVVEIKRLAALEPITYELARVEAAKQVGLRASCLDTVVAKKRRELRLDTSDVDEGQGRTVRIVDVLPWPDYVCGDMVATTLAAAVKNDVVGRAKSFKDKEADRKRRAQARLKRGS
jgi:hypothetical protein